MAGRALRRQGELQAEADEVARDLRLDELVAPLGDAVRVCSAALDLMVARDLDVTVVCPALDRPTLEGVAQLGAR